MSLTTPTGASFISGAGVDKLVRIYEGSYTTGDLATRTGSIYNVLVYEIPHDLDRPMICEVITSDDGGTTWDTATEAYAFCDSEKVYIYEGLGGPAGTRNYKVFCTWIDDYDNSNPTITTQSYTSEPTQFDSRLNYQKIFMQGELSFSAGTLGSTQTRTVTHNLGYTPNAKVFFESFSGEVWPMHIGGAGNGLLYDYAQDECSAEIYDTYMDVTMYRFSNAVRRAWYRIYYDAA